MTEETQNSEQPSRAKVIGQGAGRLAGHALVGGTAGFLFAGIPAAAATGAMSPYAWPVVLRFAVFFAATWGAVAGPRAALAKAARKQQADKDQRLAEIWRKAQEARGGSTLTRPSEMNPGEQWTQGPGGRA